MKTIIAFVLLSLSALAHAVEPGSTVNIVVPFAPGGGVDAVFRNMQAFAATKNVNLSPIYKPGAGGVVGIKELTSMPADGSVLGIAPASAMAQAIKKHKNINVDTITSIRNSVWGVVVNSNSNYNSYDELVSATKQGKIVFGQGAAGQLIVIQQLISEIKPTTQPSIAAYKGAGPAVNDLLGNHIDVIIVPLVSAMKHVESGNLKVLATIGPSSKFKDVPRIDQIYSNWVQADMFGLVAPVGLTNKDKQFWNDFMMSYLTDKTVLESFEKDFTNPGKFGPEQFNNAVKVNLELLK